MARRRRRRRRLHRKYLCIFVVLASSVCEVVQNFFSLCTVSFVKAPLVEKPVVMFGLCRVIIAGLLLICYFSVCFLFIVFRYSSRKNDVFYDVLLYICLFGAFFFLLQICEVAPLCVANLQTRSFLLHWSRLITRPQSCGGTHFSALH